MEKIFEMTFGKVPFNLQGLWLSLQRYGLKVKYIPGKHIPVADFLSRLRSGETVNPDIETRVVGRIAISGKKLREDAEATDEDPALREFKNMCQEG